MRERVLAEAARRAGALDRGPRPPARPRCRGGPRRRRRARVGRRRARPTTIRVAPTSTDRQTSPEPPTSPISRLTSSRRPIPAGRRCTCGIPRRSRPSRAARRSSACRGRHGRRPSERHGAAPWMPGRGPHRPHAERLSGDRRGGGACAAAAVGDARSRARRAHHRAGEGHARRVHGRDDSDRGGSGRRSRRCDRWSCATRSCRAPANSSPSPKGRCRRRWRAARISRGGSRRRCRWRA